MKEIIVHAFDPAKCDHGTEHEGKTEWDWCENCDPIRYWKERAELAEAKFESVSEAVARMGNREPIS